VVADERLELYAEPRTGIVVWRLKKESFFDQVLHKMPLGSTSITTIAGVKWFRNVAANPSADVDLLIAAIQGALPERT
jgi:hypothetical protein